MRLLFGPMISFFLLYGIFAGATLRIAQDNLRQPKYEVGELLKMSLAELGEIKTTPHS